MSQKLRIHKARRGRVGARGPPRPMQIGRKYFSGEIFKSPYAQRRLLSWYRSWRVTQDLSRPLRYHFEHVCDRVRYTSRGDYYNAHCTKASTLSLSLFLPSPLSLSLTLFSFIFWSISRINSSHKKIKPLDKTTSTIQKRTERIFAIRVRKNNLYYSELNIF